MEGTKTQGLRAVLADLALCQVARTLRRVGVPVAPLKGALWHKTLYAQDPHRRRLVDVDVLVPEHLFVPAQQALAAAGFRALTSALDPRERTFVEPTLPIQIDLHGSLFPAGRYRLPTATLFSRAEPSQTLFDEPVWVLDPVDQLLHLLGHFVCAHLPPSPRYQEDLARLVKVHRLDADLVARRARQAGMGRTTALALELLATPPVDTFAQHASANAAPTPSDRVALGAARALLRRSPPHSARATLAAHLCGRSLPGAALTLTTAWLHRRRTRGAA